ncbi:hypothetical protein BDQ17DRAFT_1426884 [Cyathus striatus]|nr:hypothetical protein BDQ17DRAFT_1426884 [Cyathus striatus]
MSVREWRPEPMKASDDNDDDEFEGAWEEFSRRIFDPKASTFDSRNSSFDEDQRGDWQDGSDVQGRNDALNEDDVMPFQTMRIYRKCSPCSAFPHCIVRICAGFEITLAEGGVALKMLG